MNRLQRLRRVDLQVSILTAVIVIISCTGVYFMSYSLTHADMIYSLQQRVMSMASSLDSFLQAETFLQVRTPADEGLQTYLRTKQMLESVRGAADARYLYTAARTEDGDYIYLVDGLPAGSEDFRHAGDPIEPEIIPELERALNGQVVLPDEIKATSWGYIFIAYLPVHDGEKVVGVLGVEFDAGHQYTTYRLFRLITPLVIAASCLIAGLVAMMLFRRISNPTFKDLATTDFLTGLRNRNAYEVAMGNLDTADLPGMAVIAVDLDGLKHVNDTFGHRAGDAYIRACAQAMQAAVTKPDMVYRIGGDEFAAVLHRKTETDIHALLRALKEQTAQNRGDSPVPLSLSVGYALFDETQDRNLFAAMDRADTMMYEHKRERRRERAGGPPA